MENIYVKMLIDERNKAGVSAKSLCEGICSEDMYYKLENGESSIDRVSNKRLMARIGLEKANYESYLEFADYEIWKKRMDIINSIEDGELAKAEKILLTYFIDKDDVKNRSRNNIEEQFCIFMKLQIMRGRDMGKYEDDAKALYEKAVKLTVPDIDRKPLEKLVVSPLEMNLVLEYKSRGVKDKSLYDKLDMYRQMLLYIENAVFGKLAQVKVYPKAVVYMYRDISGKLNDISMDERYKIYDEMLKYSEQGLDLLKTRKSMYYMTEILEMRADILSWFMENTTDTKRVQEYKSLREENTEQVNVLKELYISYGREPYMTDDCYFYRESGVYCINEVVKIRRKMINKTQEDLSDEDISVTTIRRLEAMKKNINKAKFKNLFEKLSLYPDYVNVGIVSEKKEAVDMYEELRFAMVSFRYDDAEKLIHKLKKILTPHRINEQALNRMESIKEWRMGKISCQQHVENLKRSLEFTIKLDDIRSAEKIFLTTEEISEIYLISSAYKRMQKYDMACMYIKEIVQYCEEIEKQKLEDGRMGIYEMIMTYVASLYGDIGRYDESNHISHKLIKLSLKLRCNNIIHPNLYNIAWNNNECNNDDFDYNAELRRCIWVSQLAGDLNDEIFYSRKITV